MVGVSNTQDLTSTEPDPDSPHLPEAESVALLYWGALVLSWLCAYGEPHELLGWVVGQPNPSESQPCEFQLS